SRNGEIDSKEGFAGENHRQIDVRHRFADDLEIFRILELYGGDIRRSDRCRLRGQVAVTERALGRIVDYTACGRGTLRLGNAPRLRSSSDEHLSSGGADLPHGNPVGGRRGTTACYLRTIFRIVNIALLDADILPVGVEFFGDEHRQHDLD